MTRHTLPPSLVLLVACSAAGSPAPSETSDDSTDASSTEDDSPNGDESSSSTSSTSSTSDDSTSSTSSTSDDSTSSTDDGDADGLPTTDGDEGNTPDQPGCCYCISDHSWQCVGWNAGEEACLLWGADDLGTLTTWYVADCPAAWTPNFDDDKSCPGACG